MMKTIKRHRRHGVLRRVGVIALLLALCVQLLPAPEAAAADLNWTATGENRQLSEGTAVQNTYILEISSGTRYGGGVAENVLFFSVTYTGTDGYSHTAILMPGEGALADGFKTASAVANRDDRRQTVERIFGVQTAALDQRKALGSVQTDQLMFTTPEEIERIDRIQIFGKRTDAASDWACQGMRVFRVDTLYGLEMYGWYSDTGYIDFDGEMIAGVNMPEGGVVFKWDNSGGMYDITPAGSVDLSLNNTVRRPHHSQTGSTAVFRIDLADAAGAGLESLAGRYSLGSNTHVEDLKLCECIALTVRYKDVYGCIREIALPFIVNAIGQALESHGEDRVNIAEYAQQGDSIAMSAMLPDYESIESVEITVGGTRAAAEAHLISSPAAQDEIRAARLQQSNGDAISYVCFAVYDDVQVQTAMDGAMLRYRFLPGENNPTHYSTATALDGIRLDAGTTTPFTLQNYYDKMTLRPSDRMERYLVTLFTDNVPNAGTSGDVVLQFRYISIKDKELESTEYRVRDYVREFYGEWPGSTDDFAYRYGLRDGGAVQFIIPLQGVKEFKDVSVRVEGNDEWQFSGMTVAMVRRDSEQGNPRIADWKEISEGNLRSHLQYTRSVDTEPVCFDVGKTYALDEKRPDPTEPDSGWTPGTLIQDDDTDHIFDGESREVTEKEDVDWAKLRHYMTYEDTKLDLGFMKERFEYEVVVQVAGKTVNAGNDDCGSKNLFYFRLIFENGTSGFTLANQQVQGDAFRTGAQVHFRIPVSQDYGDVTAVQVIPDSQDGNSDIYDKLQIEYISVTRKEEGSISPTWTARDTGEDGLGWVGIDYRDPGEMGTNAGARGRTLAELASTYQITETNYSANLLVSITTGAYARGAQQFSGGLSMTLRYFNTEGKIPPVEGIDAVAAMNAYAGRTGARQRTVLIGNELVTEDVSYEVSDPDYQFRPGSTDSFLVTVEDVYQLADLSLSIRSNVVTDWTITSVNVYQVNAKGKRIINAYGAYDYVYPEGQGLTRVATWTLDEEESLTRRLSVYRPDKKDSVAVINIALDSSPIELSQEARSWSSRILPVPPSHDDTLNIMLHPTMADGGGDPDLYDVTAAVQFTNINNRMPMQASAGKLHRGTDGNGDTVFYMTGISASDMDSLDSVTWVGQTLRSVRPAIDSGIVQRIRGGVLIETYELTGVSGVMHAVPGADMTPHTQRVLLQLGEATRAQTLRPRENDLAVAVYFRPAAPLNQEYRSKYIYLTDAGYTQIRPGQVLELDFELGEIAEITAVNLVSAGNLNVTTSNLLLADIGADGAVQKTWSVQGIQMPTERPARYPVSGNVQQLTLQLTTAEDETAARSGTDGPVRLTVGYYDIYGTLRKHTLENARDYAVPQGENAFDSGSTAEIRLLLPDFDELRWVELEPLSGTGGQNAEALASWKLARVTASVGVNGPRVNKQVDQRIMENEPLRVVLADVIVIGTVQVMDNKLAEAAAPGQETTVVLERASVYSGEEKTMTIDSGAYVRVSARVSGSDEGAEAMLVRVDPVTGAETTRGIMDRTHEYTDEYLDKLYYFAHASATGEGASDEERAAAQAVVAQLLSLQKASGTFRTEQVARGASSEFVLTPPRNFTGSSQTYRLRVAAREATEAYFTLNVIVRPEKDTLPKLVEDWEAIWTVAAVNVTERSGYVVDPVAVPKGAETQQLLGSGGTIRITARDGGYGDTELTLRSLDPSTGATGQAQLEATHGYSAAVLEQQRSMAQSIRDDPRSTAEERAAAAVVLEQIREMDASAGSVASEQSELRFTAPRNFTGSSMYYRVTGTSRMTGDVLFTVNISVQQETNPLAAAISQLEAALNKAALDRQSEAAGTAAGSGGDTPAPTGGDTPAPTGGDAPAPADGDTPVPTGGDTPAPTGGDAPAPTGGDAPAPTGGDTPAPAGGTETGGGEGDG